MGKDRRKKEGSKKQPDTSVPIGVGSEPKAQRDPKNRVPQEQGQKDSSKHVDGSVRNNVSDHNLSSSQSDSKPEPPNTAELFANLKRETDDIKALKSKKIHRQIFSNWARYDEPLPGPDHETELQGADFEALLKVPIAGHFQFKSERIWDDNITSLSGELFSLDVDLLADGLATLPLYQQLDLPVSLFDAAELEDMDYYAKQCAVRYETTRSSLSRKHDRKGLDATVCPLLNIMLMKEGSPALPDEDVGDKKTSVPLCFDIAQPGVQPDVIETTVNVHTVADSSGMDPDTQIIPETSSGNDVNEKTELNRNEVFKVQLNATDSDVLHHSFCTEENMLPAVTPTSEVVHISGAVKAEVTKSPVQLCDFEQTEHVPESVVPLGQRSNRHKPRHKSHPAQVQKVDSQKLQQTDDDLEFLLSLKKPVKEAKVPSLKPSEATKATIDDDDDAVGPNASQFALMASHKQTENLEDWLDSMLDD
jgi:hypothetical protein